MWQFRLRKAGPQRGMEPEEAFAFAFLLLIAWYVWQMAYPWFGVPIEQLLGR